ncbi:hypothetical protein SDC9_195303 [bioreactor metagenome]|uniref:Uncharacterized protein n=1 Tax=bioreactor metagenome TaxID=1076179 RepID=A0A645IB85_9ZZZZ
MPNRSEFRQRHTTDAQGGRIRTLQDRVLPLEFLQLAEQAVVLGVRNGRRIEDVVGVIVPFQFGA